MQFYLSLIEVLLAKISFKNFIFVKSYRGETFRSGIVKTHKDLCNYLGPVYTNTVRFRIVFIKVERFENDMPLVLSFLLPWFNVNHMV